MAFTSDQEARIRRYLGYPDLWRYKDTRLEGAMDSAGADPDASALVIADLAQIAAIDAKITSEGVDNAGVKAVDEIEFFENGGAVETWRNIGRSIIGRISTTLGVPLYADYYGTRGYPGDAFMGGTGGAGGNIIPLG